MAQTWKALVIFGVASIAQLTPLHAQSDPRAIISEALNRLATDSSGLSRSDPRLAIVKDATRQLQALDQSVADAERQCQRGSQQACMQYRSLAADVESSLGMSLAMEDQANTAPSSRGSAGDQSWAPPEGSIDSMADMQDPNYCNRPDKQYTPYCGAGRSSRREVSGLQQQLDLQKRCNASGNPSSDVCRRSADLDAAENARINSLIGAAQGQVAAGTISNSMRQHQIERDTRADLSSARQNFNYYAEAAASARARGDLKAAQRYQDQADDWQRKALGQ